MTWIGRSKDAQMKEIQPSTKALFTSVAPNKLQAGARDATVRIMALEPATWVWWKLSANDLASGVVCVQTASADETSIFVKERPAAKEVAIT